MVDVQEIKVKSVSNKVSGNWEETKKLGVEIEALGTEIEGLLNKLASKYKELNAKTSRAYVAAPSTDCGYGVSPISPVRMAHGLKAHLLKYGMRVDNYHFGDEDKLPKFSAVVADGVQWLLKYSK